MSRTEHLKNLERSREKQRARCMYGAVDINTVSIEELFNILARKIIKEKDRCRLPLVLYA